MYAPKPPNVSPFTTALALCATLALGACGDQSEPTSDTVAEGSAEGTRGAPACGEDIEAWSAFKCKDNELGPCYARSATHEDGWIEIMADPALLDGYELVSPAAIWSCVSEAEATECWDNVVCVDGPVPRCWAELAGEYLPTMLPTCRLEYETPFEPWIEYTVCGSGQEPIGSHPWRHAGCGDDWCYGTRGSFIFPIYPECYVDGVI